MLPVDMQREILKYNPYFYRLRKDNEDQLWFYENQCGLPITKDELIHYIFDDRPEDFALFFEDYYTLTSYKFFNYDENSYYVNKERLAVIQRDEDVKSVLLESSEPEYVNKDVNLVKFIDHLYYYPVKNIYFDIDTVFYILSRRLSCMKINPNYNKIQTRNIMDSILFYIDRVNDLDSYYQWLKHLYYLNYHGFIDFPLHIDGVYFDNNGKTSQLGTIEMEYKMYDINYEYINSYIANL